MGDGGTLTTGVRARADGSGARRSRSLGAVVLLLAGALVAACAPPPPAQPSPLPDRPPTVRSPVEPPVPSCTSASMRSCALPYPSDEFSVADPTTLTGRRTEVPVSVLPAALTSQLGPGASVEDAFGSADGFASLSPVVFELDRGIDAASVPWDGGDVLRVFDADTGVAQPIRAEVSADAGRLGAADTIVVAWPLTRWEPGHRYVARLTTAVTSPWGPVVRAPGVVDGSSGFLSSVRADLARIEGDRWDEVVQATRFTVRSSADATSAIDAMVAATRAAEHPVRNLEVGPPLLADHAGAVVRGEVLVSDFRDADGVVRPHATPTPRWERFMLVVPQRPAGPDGAPVVVYGHGLTVSKETMITVAGVNAARGVATVGIDVPNHGERQADEGGYLLDLTNPGVFGRLVGMPTQGVVDHVSLVEAIEHLDGLDLSPWRLEGAHGDGVADLDTSRLLYEGTSMGGVLGASVVSLLPELAGGYLQVAGTGIADIIYHSMLWVAFLAVVPAGSTAGDGAALMGAATMLLDAVDNVNLLPRLRDGGPPLFLQYGVGDMIVPNVDSERMVSMLGLPLVGRRIAEWTPGFSMADPAGDAIPADGRGVRQVRNPDFDDVSQSFAGHLSFLDPEAMATMDAWLQNRLVSLGLDGGLVTGP